jgi:hypothetical protein
VGLRAGLDIVWKRKIPIPCRESNPDHPIVQPIGLETSTDKNKNTVSLCVTTKNASPFVGNMTILRCQTTNMTQFFKMRRNVFVITNWYFSIWSKLFTARKEQNTWKRKIDLCEERRMYKP